MAEPGSSASAFLRALDLQRKAHAAGTGPGPSTRLLNNTGVLQYRSKRYHEALELMLKAQEQLEQEGVTLSSAQQFKSAPVLPAISLVISKRDPENSPGYS